jgi:hypothetical protein
MGKGRTASVVTTDVAEGDINTSFDVAIGPNPASQSVNVDLYLPTASAVTVYIADITGSIVRQQDFDMLSGGSHSIGFDVSDLTAGGYQIVVKTRSQTMVKALAVIR